uniref:Fem-1 homolog A n=1 Tax=Strigops habroptila TaxID=2489341 RepID=A0A672V320_STRHB
MDLRTAVYNAARDGEAEAAAEAAGQPEPGGAGGADGRARRRRWPPAEGSTPLLIAARHGHLEVVEYLLDHCGARVEEGGSVNFDGETIEGAPPLWAASAAGHLGVVRSLLGSRCLREPDHADQLHAPTGTDTLKGADVNRRSGEGEYSPARLRRVRQPGDPAAPAPLQARMEKDGYGMTPLLAASVTGHTNIVEYLIQGGLQQEDEALELLGATFVDKKRDLLGAHKYWRRAMELRCEGGQYLPKPEPRQLVLAYDYSREVSSLEELEALITDPDEMRMQALLIRERILGPSHPDTSYYIRYRGAVYADSGNFERCINLWKYALDMQQGNLEPLSPMTASSFLSFAELFSYVLQDRSKGTLATHLGFSDLMGVLSKGVREVERALVHGKDPVVDSAQFTKTLAIILHLVFLLEKVECTPEQEHQKRQAIYRLLKCSPRAKNGFTPLHMAVDKDTTTVGRYPVGKFPSLHVVNLLLECGADPDSRDYDNNTPLHIAARNNCPLIMSALMEAGAHMDATNAFKQTAYELLDEKLLTKSMMQPFNYITLQCLAARALDKHKIPYKGFIPEELEAFIELH